MTKKIFAKGFTLVELLISMGIMSILLVILTEVFGSIISMRLGSEAETALSQDSRYLLTRLSYDVGRATSITLPTVGQTSSNLVLVIDSQSYSYSLNGNQLELTIGGGIPVKLNSSGTALSSLGFTRNNDLDGKANITISSTLLSTIREPGKTSNTLSITTSLSTK